ncbi:hypothetical protein [Acidipropionibacterium virtanenii]
MANRFLAGQSVRQITRWLNRDGWAGAAVEGQEPVERVA